MVSVGTTIGTVYRVFTTLHMIAIAFSRPFLPCSKWSSPQSLQFVIRSLRCTWLSPQSQEAFVCVCYAAGDYYNNHSMLCRMSARLQMMVTTIRYGLPFLYHDTRDCHRIQRRLFHMSVPLQMIVTTVTVGLVRCSSSRRSMFSKLFSRGPLSASKNTHGSLYPCVPKYSVRMIGIQKLNRYISELTLDSYGYIPVAYLVAQYMIWP